MTHEEIDGVHVGQHEVVSHFMKGAFHCRPPTPATWDVDMVLKFVTSLLDNTGLPLTTLTHKLAMLLVLSNANRCSELVALDLRFSSFYANGVKFLIRGLTKTRIKGPPKEAFYLSVPENGKLCPVNALLVYRGEQRIFTL